MKHVRELILLVCLAFSASALAQIETKEIELKIYDVAPENRDEIYSALQHLVGGAVQMLPTGQILVRTTPEFHEQVATVLDAVSRHVAEPTPRVTLQYWVVLGNRVGPGDADMPPSLDDVLEEIRQVHGSLSFRLMGNATLVTDSGMSGRTQGELSIGQLAYVQGTRLQANLQIGFNYFSTGGAPDVEGQARVSQRIGTGQQVEIDTSMEQGEYVVVGENSITDNVEGEGQVDGTLFYIVHWPIAD